MMKNVLILGMRVLFCVPAFAESWNVIAKIKELDRSISMIITDGRLKYLQCEEIKEIGRSWITSWSRKQIPRQFPLH